MYNLKGLRREERISAALSALYSGRGYKKYKLCSFEEYSVYLDNRDFLIGKNIISFSGLDGKLYALRPDVTISVIKNVNTDETEKLFYNEKVYRTVGEDFKEVSQTGVEVIGNIDLVTEAEVAGLILDTLKTVSDNYLLDLSHMGFVSGVISSFGLNEEAENRLYGLLKTKSVHDVLRSVPGLGGRNAEIFAELVAINGAPETAIKKAEKLCVNAETESALNELKSVVEVLGKTGRGENVNINFSIANNADYYNGIIFNGYIEGVPHAVLSGGRYDKLLKKFGKDAGAIGFALYLGELERYFSENAETTDALIIYGCSDAADAIKAADKLIEKGFSVRLASKLPVGESFNKVYRLCGGKLTEVENA